MPDAYSVCWYIRHYYEKNGYLPLRSQLPGCDAAYVDKLVTNGVIEVLPYYEGGPPLRVVLTEKGRRMAARERTR